MLGAASCATRSVPPPAPAPAPAPPPVRPAPPPPPPPLAWQDAPLSPGDWSFRDGGAQSAATYGAQAPALIVSCGADRRISLVRPGASGAALTLRTTNGERALAASMTADGLAATLVASDPLLDALAFSRGRIAIEAAGTPLLIVPSWPEPARVIEDCRE
ncbi:MAG: hypothetical protein ICV73_18930 [Acetobacteraceae bacterium]|nr:hypothetical protein [Acetobacteraceae bacterium]